MDSRRYQQWGRAHQRFFSAPWSCLGSFLAGAAEAAPSGAVAAMPAGQGLALDIDRGVPLSAPWSCLAIGLAQSWDIGAPPMGVLALAEGGVCAETAWAAEAKRAEANKVRNVLMTVNSRWRDALGSVDRLAGRETGSNRRRCPSLVFTTAGQRAAAGGIALVRAARTAVCQCQAL